METAATPSPPVTSSPAPAPSTPAPQSISAAQREDALMADDFGDLDKLSTKPEPKPKPAPPKPNESDIEGKLETDASEEAKKQTEPKPANKSSVNDLRKQYETSKKENYALKEELKRFKEATPQEDPQVKTLKERYEAADKRRAELEDEIRFASYERSPEYQDKYQKPYMDAYEWGKQTVSRLKVNLEDGTTRQATPEDFDKILIPDDGDATDLADQMFGNKSKIALDHRWELKKLDAARFRAIEDFKKQGGEREMRLKETESKRDEQIGQLWKQLNGEAAERFPKYFKPEEGDEDGNKMLEAGYALADSAFSKSNGKSPEETVKLHASIRNRAAAFTREVYRNSKLQARVTELESELEQFKNSEPKNGDGKSGEVGEQTFEELMADA
jgi:hypothetical protein